MPSIGKLTWDRWEELAWADNRPVCVPVVITHKDKVTTYAVSPDGIGAYYYDTLIDLVHDFLDLDSSWYEAYPTKDCTMCKQNLHRMVE